MSRLTLFAPADARREFISGFSGSAGTAVVTAADAKLWTDGRYFLQATKQLDASAGWALMKGGLPETPSIESWLASSLAAGEVVGLDPTVTTLSTVKSMRAALEKKGIRLCTSLRSNLVDEVWGAEQPPAPSAPVMVQPLRYTGCAAADKIARVQAALAKEGASALVITALDEIAWLFNIRGADIECERGASATIPLLLRCFQLLPAAASLMSLIAVICPTSHSSVRLDPVSFLSIPTSCSLTCRQPCHYGLRRRADEGSCCRRCRCRFLGWGI